MDRMSLSIKNRWVDEENRAYIYFKLDDAMDMLRIGKDKGIKLFAELDAEKGCGLITRKKQGLGKPTIIYVMMMPIILMMRASFRLLIFRSPVFGIAPKS